MGAMLCHGEQATNPAQAASHARFKRNELWERACCHEGYAGALADGRCRKNDRKDVLHVLGGGYLRAPVLRCGPGGGDGLTRAYPHTSARGLCGLG